MAAFMVPVFSGIPYIDRSDVLPRQGHSLNLAYFPPTQPANQPIPLDNALQQPMIQYDVDARIKDKRLRRIHGIIAENIENDLNPIFGLDPLHEFKRWLEEYRSTTANPDINRLLRYAVYYSAMPIVQQLVDHEGANLYHPDILGRSAIFYAIAADLDMLEYVASDQRPGFDQRRLISKDHLSQSPVHYAVKRSAEYTEVLQSSATDPAIHARIATTVQSLISKDTTLNKAIWQNYAFKELVRRNPDMLFSLTFTNPNFLYGQEAYTFCIDCLENDVTIWESYEEGQVIWAHVPTNNGIILAALFKSVQKLLRPYLRSLACEPGYFVELFLDSFKEPSTTPGDPLLAYRDWACDYTPRSVVNGARWDYFSVVFPCLVLEKVYNKVQKRSEFQAMKDAISGGSPHYNIHTKRTLDEAYFPGLNTKFFTEQNLDQVVSREYRKDLKLNHDDASAPIIMVSQLWFWSIDDWLFSAGSQIGTWPLSGDTDTETGGDDSWQPRMRASSPGLQIGLVIADQINRFGKPQADGVFAPPLDYFEMGVVRTLSEAKEYLGEKNLEKLDIDKEKGLLHDISDIRNELVMIKDVLGQQQDVVDQLIEYYSNKTVYLSGNEQKKYGAGDWKQVADAKKKLEKYVKRVDKIDGDAERIEKIVQTQLDLKRTYSSIRDTRNSLILSTAVIGFTVITVIFTPLAFMTSLFALPLEQLRKHQKKDDNGAYYETYYVKFWFGIAEGASLGFTVIAVVLSLVIMKWGKKWRRGIKHLRLNFKLRFEKLAEKPSDKHFKLKAGIATDVERGCIDKLA